MRFTLKETRLGLRNSTTRIPFRYGKACLTRCPQAVFEATIEIDGQLQAGYSGDCLPPGWFDKTPGKPFSQQIDDMLSAIELAAGVFGEEAAKPVALFPAWLAAYRRVQQAGSERGWNELLASFGLSIVERAVMDALARAAGMSFARAVRENIYAIEPGEVDKRLAGLAVRQWLPEEPLRSILVRHTIGLGDPLTEADIAPEDRIDDGFPQALEQYVEQSGVRYFKIKVSNNLEVDRQRLLAIAAICHRHLGSDYRVTLDGNEQYKNAEDFAALVETLRGTPQLEALLMNTICIEQPLERGIALDERYGAAVRELSLFKPVIIDESDGTLDAYARAMEIGYRGVSSKNCKGPIKSLLNAGLTWLANDRGTRTNYLMTGEDLCSVGIIPVQADLALAATLGLSHVERNGHHYHPGLSYLPEPQREAALSAHGDFYARRHGVVAPRLVDGRFEIGSLQCVGFGFDVVPDFDSMQSPEEWDFASLGLEE